MDLETLYMTVFRAGARFALDASGGLKYRGPKAALTPDMRAAITEQHRAEIIGDLKRSRRQLMLKVCRNRGRQRHEKEGGTRECACTFTRKVRQHLITEDTSPTKGEVVTLMLLTNCLQS